MKSLKRLFAPLALMFIVLGIWLASSLVQQNRPLSNSETSASETPAPAPTSAEQLSPQTATHDSGTQAPDVINKEQIRSWKTYRYQSVAVFVIPKTWF
jgi:hypothetical protein